METYNEKILVVDNEIRIRKILKTRLAICGYEVLLASTGNEALFLFKKEQPNLIILDTMLPILDGYQVCSEIRKESCVPIIILTAFGSVTDRVMGLELGADDYILKPFSPKELEARIRALLRRTKHLNTFKSKNTHTNLRIGNLTIDKNKRQVFKGVDQIKLTGMEYNLLELLVHKAGERVSRNIILHNVWGYKPERFLDTRVVDVHISRLRSKLETDPTNPEYILTARGTGYMFQKYQDGPI